VLLAATIWACGDDDGQPPATPTVVQPATKPTASATPPLSAPSALDPPLVEVTGLFTDPRPSSPAIARPLASGTPSFSPWDGTSTMLYDIGAGTETNLGPGSVGRFSPDGSKLVWIANPQPPHASGEAMLLDIATGERRSLGEANLTFFDDDEHAYLSIIEAEGDGGHCEQVNLTTGESTPRTCSPGGHGATTTADGYTLYGGGKGAPVLLKDGDGQLLLRFDADRAMPAGPGALLIATVPVEVGQRDAEGRFTLVSNLFLVDIATGATTFIATANATTTEFMQLPLAVNERYVAWTDNYCGGGTTYLFDRQSYVMYDLGQTLWPRGFTPDGLLAEGASGVRSLIDVEAPAYRVVLDGEPQWSPDWRYASVGRVGGHGGVCI